MKFPFLLRSLGPDIVSLPLWLKIFAFFLACFSIIFSVIDINYLVHPSDLHPALLQWTSSRLAGITLWRRCMMTLSGIASFSGVLCVVLAARGRYSTFFWGIINCVTYGLFAFAYGYAGTAQLNVMFFLPMQFVGLYTWAGNLDTTHSAIARSLGLLGWPLSLISALGLAVAFYYEIPPFARAVAGAYFFSDLAVAHRLDAASNALNILGQVLMLLRYWEQWVWWISVDVVQVLMYTGKVEGVGLDVNVLVMFVCFLGNAVYGGWVWFQRAKNGQMEMGGEVGQRREDQGAGQGGDLEGGDYAPAESRSSAAKDSITTTQIQVSGKAGEATGAKAVEGGPQIMGDRGLVIGKFWPPHKGHMYLIEYALAHCNHLFIIVGERHDRVELPSGSERRDFLQKTYPTASVILIDDKYDQDDSKLWASLTKDFLGFVPDVVFTSESYGDAYCRFLGSKHILVDLHRTHVPITATKIRADPYGNWAFLSPLAKQLYAIRIVILGAESTGKTTLSQRLAEHYRTSWIPEVGREVTEDKLASGEYIWRMSDFVEIASAQKKREDFMAAGLSDQGPPLLICDTDAWTTGVWCERYMGVRDAEVEKVGQHKAVLYLLPDLEGKPFVQDGTRDGEHIREWMYKRFLERLTEEERSFAILEGGYEQMYEKAIQHVDRVLDLQRNAMGNRLSEVV